MLIDIFPDNPDQRKIDQVIDILNHGGLIVVPTDTIYAFAASVKSKKGLEKLAKIKNVKLNKSEFSLICDDLSEISTYTKPIDRKVFRTMKNAFPGPYTFILNANNNIAKLFGTNKKEVGIRVPNHGFTRSLIRSLGHPLVSSSVHDDDEIVNWSLGSASRWWLHNSLESLSSNLRDRGSRLHVQRGSPPEVLADVARLVGAQCIYFQRRIEPTARAVEVQVENACAKAGIEVCASHNGLFFTPGTVATGQGNPYQVFTPFWKRCLQQE